MLFVLPVFDILCVFMAIEFLDQIYLLWVILCSNIRKLKERHATFRLPGCPYVFEDAALLVGESFCS